VAKQKQFADLNHFDYPLLADVGAVVAGQFGVRRGRLGAKLGAPVKRATFVIGVDQRVRAVITSETNMARHADDALAALL
jgi:peroxiredoxin Q/BCP